MRASSWRKRARQCDEGDLDARFVLWWIGFNALYGQARYRGDRGGSELADIERFLDVMVRLGPRTVPALLKQRNIKGDVETLLRDKYLHDCCWREWDRKKIYDRNGRETVVPSCNEKGDDELFLVFKRLYVLRKQIFHGCSKERSSKNRPSLRAALPVLEHCVNEFLALVATRGGTEVGKRLIEDPPYPPTQAADAHGILEV
jgi:hypothetical protein